MVLKIISNFMQSYAELPGIKGKLSLHNIQGDYITYAKGAGKMIVVHESEAIYEMSKPIVCPKCKRGKLGSIAEWSDAITSRRGRPPPGERSEGVQLKCPVCKKLWAITTK